MPTYRMPEEQAQPLRATARASALTRIVDVVVATALLVSLAPVMAFVAFAIAVSDGGVPLFRQQRTGRNGQTFEIMKFRTMVRDAERRLDDLLAADPELRDEFARTCKLRNDPRVNRLGRWLRATGVDELPQLVNVLRGDMSLVGPRPVPAHELRRYGPAAALVTFVRPGITGPWQLSDRASIGYSERVAMDCEYVLTKTLRRDLQLIVRTGVKFTAGRLGGW